MTDDLSTRLLEAIEDFGQHEPDADLVLRLCQAHREIVELCAAEINYGTDGAVTASSVLDLLRSAYNLQEET